MWNTHKASWFCEKKCQQQGNSVASIINSPARSPLAAPKVRTINTSLATDARRSAPELALHIRGRREKPQLHALYLFIAAFTTRACRWRVCVVYVYSSGGSVTSSESSTLCIIYCVFELSHLRRLSPGASDIAGIRKRLGVSFWRLTLGSPITKEEKKHLAKSVWQILRFFWECDASC